MDSEDTETVISKDDKISTAEEEIDKKFVSQAVAFVIGHTRNGFVALCASVATLLKEQAKLKLENESLKQQISVLQCKQSESYDFENKSDNSEREHLYSDKTYLDTSKLSRLKRKDFQQKGYRALKGCICNSCTNVTEITKILSAPLKKGDRVVISGEISGTVCYVGHVEALTFPDIFIGLYLDEPVGDTNGSIGKKRYFSVPQGYGLFAPLWNVCCIID
ncbi:CAP-Gly domain-containing protein [Trichonephila clavata]|uniref:CAP-Gly domain-containing protein n=1 Tax=Trichonephila clavata TaxID=2740835 RepID=A0A8X6FHL0_TRICU|nr:CAP-Gly domain-containing protein [Trichonephila clavata]